MRFCWSSTRSAAGTARCRRLTAIVVVELPNDKTCSYTRGRLRVTGKLELNSTDPENYLYRLRDAKAVEGDQRLGSKGFGRPGVEGQLGLSLISATGPVEAKAITSTSAAVRSAAVRRFVDTIAPDQAPLRGFAHRCRPKRYSDSLATLRCHRGAASFARRTAASTCGRHGRGRDSGAYRRNDLR